MHVFKAFVGEAAPPRHCVSENAKIGLKPFPLHSEPCLGQRTSLCIKTFDQMSDVMCQGNGLQMRQSRNHTSHWLVGRIFNPAEPLDDTAGLKIQPTGRSTPHHNSLPVVAKYLSAWRRPCRKICRI